MPIVLFKVHDISIYPIIVALYTLALFKNVLFLVLNGLKKTLGEDALPVFAIDEYYKVDFALAVSKKLMSLLAQS